MPFAIEAYFDVDADARVRSLWATLDRAGIPSLGAAQGGHQRPHVSFAAFDDCRPEAVTAAVETAATEAVGLELTFSALGFFVTDEAPAFLAVTVTRRLLEVHARLFAGLEDNVTGYWPYYRPDVLVPHCTLAMHLERPSVVHDALPAVLPFSGTVVSVNLVDVTTGASVLQLAPRTSN